MAASKTTKKRKRKPAAKQQPVGNRFQTEILILVMFAACLILMISAFGMGGIVGNAISAVCFGIMGLCAYIFPILLFAGVTFLIVNNTNRLAYKKVLAGVVFFVFLCGFLQLITEGYTPSTTFSDYYSLSSEYRTGGGVFGGAAGLTGHPAVRVNSQHCIQHRIRDTVAHLVGMALGHRLRRKQLSHTFSSSAFFLSSCSW